MPELLITETSPHLKVTLIEDDGKEKSKRFKRHHGKPIDWNNSEDRQGRKGLNETGPDGKNLIRLKLPEAT